jgi:MiaB/RimO family radical SAM methylthiotransferase
MIHGFPQRSLSGGWGRGFGRVFVRAGATYEKPLAPSPQLWQNNLMPVFRLITFGCKVNQCDTAGMARELVQQGWDAAAPGVAPDLVLVNTCTVTKRADQQARQAIRRLAREHPGTPVWVTGCYAQRAPAEVAALPGVQAVFGNQEKVHLAHLLSESHPPSARDAATIATGPPALADPLALPARPASPGPPGLTEARSPLAPPESPCSSANEAREGIDSPSPLTNEPRYGVDSPSFCRGEAQGGIDSPSPLRDMARGIDSPSPLTDEPRDGIDSPSFCRGEALGGVDSPSSLGDMGRGIDSPSSLREAAPGGDSPSPLRGEGWGGGEAGTGVSPPEGSPRRLVAPFSPTPPFQAWEVHAVPGHTRAWLKIQEGCSHQCRYCIVPQVRGPRRSLDPTAVVVAFQNLAGLGFREVVLTGVDLGQYGLDHAPPVSLAALVRRLAAPAFPFRVRLSSLEPMMVTPELLDELAAWQNFCPHFHLPLQSGAAPILAAMGRPYAPAEFRDLVREITRHFPGTGLGLDVLVGFPGETAADFEATRTLVAELPVTYLHVFPYSPRPGTPAAGLPPLPANLVQARARILRELGQAQKKKFLEAQLGQVREVLVEGPATQPGWLQGLSDHYLRVTFPGPPALHNRLVLVRFTRRQGEVLVGEAVDEPR